MGITLRFATYHLGEAIGELSSLLRNELSGRSSLHDSSSARSEMIHAMQHLNWYWNAATDLEESHDSFSEESFIRLSQFLPSIVSTFTQGSMPNAFITDPLPQMGESLVVVSNGNGNSASDILSIIGLITEELLVHSISEGNALVRSDDTKTMLRMYGLAFGFWIREFGPDPIAGDETHSGEETRNLIPLELSENVPISLGRQRE